MKIADTNTGTPRILAADIGGSHITTAICNPDTFAVEEHTMTRVEVDSHDSAPSIIETWKSALRIALSKTSAVAAGVSVAMPGPFDYSRGICYIKGLNKYEALYGMDIKSILADYLNISGELVRFRNDAESTVAGEALAGAGARYQKVAGITLGTGFGSAYCADGLCRDLNYGSDRYKDSIADDYLSTRWFQKRYLELTGEHVANVKALAALAPNDADAVRVFDEFAINMADFLQRPLQKLLPDVLVLCGNIVKAKQYFLPRLSEGLAGINIKIAQLGEKAALIGAAALFTNSNIAQS